jgi:hypothetical protein
MAGIRMFSSPTQGTQVEMYEEGKPDTPLYVFESIGKAGRAFGIYDKTFITVVRKQEVAERVWKGRKLRVYFKET